MFRKKSMSWVSRITQTPSTLCFHELYEAEQIEVQAILINTSNAGSDISFYEIQRSYANATME
jgi:hypothetical protein